MPLLHHGSTRTFPGEALSMTTPLHHPQESNSNTARDLVARFEPRSQRTYTPTQAVLARSAGIYHWTPEGRRLYDFTSGVLVANLGHNPKAWLQRFRGLLGWDAAAAEPGDYSPALPFTAYNAVTQVETTATKQLVELLQRRPGGRRLEQVLWAAS